MNEKLGETIAKINNVYSFNFKQLTVDVNGSMKDMYVYSGKSFRSPKINDETGEYDYENKKFQIVIRDILDLPQESKAELAERFKEEDDTRTDDEVLEKHILVDLLSANLGSDVSHLVERSVCTPDNVPNTIFVMLAVWTPNAELAIDSIIDKDKYKDLLVYLSERNRRTEMDLEDIFSELTDRTRELEESDTEYKSTVKQLEEMTVELLNRVPSADILPKNIQDIIVTLNPESNVTIKLAQADIL